MPKESVAEWVLSLLTTPDRAAAIVGDLSEQGWGTWPNYLRMTASLFVRRLAFRPVRLLVSIFLGWAVFLTLAFCEDQINPHADYDRNAALIAAGFAIALFDRGRELPGCAAWGMTVFAVRLYFAHEFRWLAPVGHGFVWEAMLPTLLHMVVLVSTGVLVRKLRPVVG